MGEDSNDCYSIFAPEYFSGSGRRPCRLEDLYVLAKGSLGFAGAG